MTDDLGELRERIGLASAEVGLLFTNWQDHINKNVITYYEGHHTTQFRISVEVKAPLPTALRVKARLIVNELKSCLDGLAVTLATRNGKNPQGV